ncbi:MAG: DHH family phosphoesterase, partial [Candidatus Heimdallarchaeota archaeon]|nr:DHH family phosphoesterase [Candidatus Heimdallarchaeota archaeon]
MLSQQFENTLETAAAEFNENLSQYGEIVSITHTDADGISSGMIIQEMLNRLKIPYHQFTFGLNGPWLDFLHSKSSVIQRAGAIFFSDLCPSGSELTKFTQEYPNIAVYILDHHLFRKDPDHPLSDKVYNCNPTQFGLHGLKEIVGATLNYLFAKAVDEKNTKSAWIAAIGMGGDVLNHINEYQSYNRIVIDEAIESGQVELHTGLCAYGGQYERVDRGLALSILPYIS